MDKQIVAYLLNGMPLSIEKEWFSDVWNGMEKSQKHYVGQNSDRKWVLTVQSHLLKVLNKQNKCVIALKNKGLSELWVAQMWIFPISLNYTIK